MANWYVKNRCGSIIANSVHFLLPSTSQVLFRAPSSPTHWVSPDSVRTEREGHTTLSGQLGDREQSEADRLLGAGPATQDKICKRGTGLKNCVI